MSKARLADTIGAILERAGLTQSRAAKLLGTDQGTVSKLVSGRLDGFSQERLIRYLTLLGCDVEITVRPASGEEGSPGRVSVGTAT
jgi:predicted XRE-type DNA-binding protein